MCLVLLHGSPTILENDYSSQQQQNGGVGTYYENSYNFAQDSIELAKSEVVMLRWKLLALKMLAARANISATFSSCSRLRLPSSSRCFMKSSSRHLSSASVSFCRFACDSDKARIALVISVKYCCCDRTAFRSFMGNNF